MQNPQLVKRKWTAHSVLAFAALKKTVVSENKYSRWWRALLAGSIIFTISACSDRGELEQSWQAYAARLSAVTNRDPQSAQLSPMPIMPRSGDMRIDIDRLSIGLLDSLRLDRCRLGQVVAQRNTSLGQAQSAAALLRYELDSIQAIEECLRQDSVTDTRIVTLLEQALAQKQHTLPLYIDQVITRSDAFRHSLRAASRPHGLGNHDGFEATQAALDYMTQTFNAALSGAYHQIDLAPYNSHMQTLSQSQFLPRHWRSMQYNAAWLSATTPALQQFNAANDCSSEQIRQGVVDIHQTHYSTVIEPLLQRSNRQHEALATNLQQLIGLSVQGAWRAYMEELLGDGSHAEQVRELSATQADAWQHALQRCHASAD